MCGEDMAQDRREGKITSEDFLDNHYERRGSPYEVILCDSPVLEKQFAQLRYKVFCEEHPEYAQTYNIDQTETDEYDGRSIKMLLVFRPLQMVVGGARVILPDKTMPFVGLPCIQHPDSYFHADMPFNIHYAAEISRFMLSKLRLKVVREFLNASFDKDELTKFASPILYLIKGLYQIAQVNNIHNYCAMLEPSLIRIIKSAGVCVYEYGDHVECHGKRQPIVIDLISLLSYMSNVNMKNANFLDDESRQFFIDPLKSGVEIEASSSTDYIYSKVT